MSKPGAFITHNSFNQMTESAAGMTYSAWKLASSWFPQQKARGIYTFMLRWGDGV